MEYLIRDFTMIVYIDIDETICSTKHLSLEVQMNYAEAEPILENIQKANKMYDKGYTIIYWTGRGRETGINWKDITEKQFDKWGIKYHELKFNKPYDIVIDDKAVNVKDWENFEM